MESPKDGFKLCSGEGNKKLKAQTGYWGQGLILTVLKNLTVWASFRVNVPDSGTGNRIEEVVLSPRRKASSSPFMLTKTRRGWARVGLKGVEVSGSNVSTWRQGMTYVTFWLNTSILDISHIKLTHRRNVKSLERSCVKFCQVLHMTLNTRLLWWHMVIMLWECFFLQKHEMEVILQQNNDPKLQSYNRMT